MYKRISGLLISFVVACTISACASMSNGGTPTDPQAAFIKQATEATTLVDAVTRAADTAVLTKVLKGEDAATTLALLQAARDGLNSAKAMAILDPTRGTSKLLVVTASLAAVQSYVIAAGLTTGAKP